ncbi:MAG: sulfite exporter TauE/SafE family protein [Bacillota bacterium]
MGCIGGFFSGFLGIGGGVVLIPLLIYWGGMEINNAATISMIFIVPASISGIICHKRLGNIIAYIGILMGIGSLIGSFSSALFADMISEFILQLIFLVVVLIAAFMLLFKDRVNTYTKKDVPIKKITTILIGLIQGTLTGMLGIGGGFIVVPLMIYFLAMPIHFAVGTSLVVIFFSANAGIIGKAAGLSLSFGSAWLVIVGAIPSAQLGGWVASKTKPYLLRYFFLILLVIIFISMLFDIIKYYS